MGRIRPRRAGGRALRPRRAGRPLAAAPRRRSTRRCAARASTSSSNSFTQAYGSDELDASTLLIPLLGFLPPNDPRVIGTIDAIQRDLTARRLRRAVQDAASTNDVDGLPGGEGVFLPCSFWLVDALLMPGRARRGARRSSSGCSRSGTTSACSPRSTTRARSGCSATSRRRSRTSVSSTRRTTSRTTRARHSSAAPRHLRVASGTESASDGRSDARAGARSSTSASLAALRASGPSDSTLATSRLTLRPCRSSLPRASSSGSPRTIAR